ncbi:hypothetical protein [uncultured Aquimarina sp.]|uniref:FEKKY domain-containing protein n=1 Tax=uncultured Aquimarina sp. TaxID=575652 RepID=UPI002635A27B|nr:hypothetical protein [uncultured Aquimarina sp.]
MIGTFSISLALNLYIFPRIYENVQINKKYAQYSEIKSCEEMEKRFLTDLEKGELQYFHFGLGSVIGMEDIMKSNYGIEYHPMGCLLRTEMECYNKLVNEYLKKNFNKSISDIQKETNIYKLIKTD